MDTLQAAVLNLKMPFVDDWNQQRRNAAAYYIEALSSSSLVLPNMDNHVFHVFSILTPQRDQLRHHLKKAGIQTQIHYPKALPFTRAYADLDHKPEDFSNAFRLQKESLSLPLFPGITKEEQDYVIGFIQKKLYQ